MLQNPWAQIPGRVVLSMLSSQQWEEKWKRSLGNGPALEEGALRKISQQSEWAVHLESQFQASFQPKSTVTCAVDS